MIAAFALALLVLAAPGAWAQVGPPGVTCPETASTPAFTAGGSLFGRIASQWNTYFGSKVDVNNGVLCSPKIWPWLQNSQLAQMPPDTVKSNPLDVQAQPQDLVVPSCPDGGGNHINWVHGVGWTCGTTVGPAAGCSVASGTRYQVLIDDAAGGCTDSTLRDDGALISATLTPTAGSPSNVLLIDPTNNNVYLGYLAGDGSTAGLNNNVSIGNGAGTGATDNDNVSIGQNAAASAVVTDSISIGQDANRNATGDGILIAIGLSAGFGTDVNNSMFIGNSAGFNLTGSAGNSGPFIALGNSAGLNMVGAGDGILIGDTAGGNSNFGSGSDFVFMGNGAGSGATTVKIGDVIGIGDGAFGNAVGSSTSNMQISDVVAIGNGAGSGMNSTGGDINEVVVVGSSGGSNTGSDVVLVGDDILGHNSGSSVIGIGRPASFVSADNSGNNVIIISNAAPANATSDFIDIGEVWSATGINTPATSTTTIESAAIVVPNLATTPGGKQPVCIDTTSHTMYAGTGGAC